MSTCRRLLGPRCRAEDQQVAAVGYSSSAALTSASTSNNRGPDTLHLHAVTPAAWSPVPADQIPAEAIGRQRTDRLRQELPGRRTAPPRRGARDKRAMDLPRATSRSGPASP